MRIVVPYTRLRAETEAALAAYAGAHQVELVDVSGGDDALWQMWCRLWQQDGDLVVIEHDIVIHAGVLPAFESCPQPWCTFGYAYPGWREYHGTGCVRFRAELVEAQPQLWQTVGRMSRRQHPPRHWCSLDAFSQSVLSSAGHRSHPHRPPVGHTDPSNSHGCLGPRQRQ